MYTTIYGEISIVNPVTYRLWGDKTLYLKNVKCYVEPKIMIATL